MRLQGKVAVITGAGSGIGLAMARRFAVEGAAIIAGDWNGARLDAAIAGIRDSGGTIAGVQGDIADRAAAEGLVDLAVSSHGRIDVLVNNAGVMDYMQGVGEVSDDIWRRVRGVRCNAICPGATRTNIGETMPPERLDPAGSARARAYAALIPAALDPGDIAALALFLASDESRRINGAIIPADAGWTAA